MPKTKRILTERVATRRIGEKRKRGRVQTKENKSESHSEVSEVGSAEPSVQQDGPTPLSESWSGRR